MLLLKELMSCLRKEDIADLIRIFKFLLWSLRYFKGEDGELKSLQPIRRNRNERTFKDQQKALTDKYRITETDKLLLMKIIEGVPLKCFEAFATLDFPKSYSLIAPAAGKDLPVGTESN